MTDLQNLIDDYELKLKESFLSAIDFIRENYPVDTAQLDVTSSANNFSLEQLETLLLRGFKENLTALHDESTNLLLLTLGLPNFEYPVSLKIEFINGQIREISAEIKKAVNTAGSNPKRILETIGLSPNQARSLRVYRQTLESIAMTQDYSRPSMDALPPEVIRNLSASQRNVIRKSIERGLDPEAIDRLVNKQYKALLAHRANAIARNMASKIAHTAQQSIINIAGKTGLINPNNYRRFWRTAHDEKVRHTHYQTEAMNGLGVGINQPFQTPLGPVMNPPLEINCRCHAVIRKVTP